MKTGVTNLSAEGAVKAGKPIARTTRYLLYAIGEIILVMIGILLALQVNNLNEKRKDKINERRVLTTLLKDLSEASEEGQLYFESDSTQVKNVRDFISSKEQRDSILLLENADYIITSGLWSVETSIPVIQLFEDIKSSGTSAIISNQDIRKKLAEIDLHVAELKFHNEDRMHVQRTYLDPFIFNELDFKAYHLSQASNNRNYKTTIDYNKLILEKGVQNKLFAKIRIGERAILRRKDYQNEMKDLISLIEKELNQHD
jgi:hypothetical protein